MKVLKIDHLGIAVNSIDQGKNFWTDVLGLEFEGSMDQLRLLPDGTRELWDFKFSAFTPHHEFLKRAVQFVIVLAAEGELVRTLEVAP